MNTQSNTMTERQGESSRFWRLNTLSAYQDAGLIECLASDPEDLAHIKAIKTEIAGLRAREEAVKTRYKRILEYRKRPAQGVEKANQPIEDRTVNELLLTGL